MGTIAPPVVGDWYMLPKGESFEVVAYDHEDETVEIQYFDGAVEEFELETWIELSAEPIEPPEDWSGSVDIMREDYWAEDRANPYNPKNPLDELDIKDKN
ncbi:MAG: hypothetical protein L0H63_06810 [Nitrococcus sp.]|nr:hypothetical protein [Nitrococcus sp.]